MGTPHEPLLCPNCGGKIAWNGSEHVCLSCNWTEFEHKPPFEKKVEPQRKKRQKGKE
jgi:hypothetical protein